MNPLLSQRREKRIRNRIRRRLKRLTPEGGVNPHDVSVQKTKIKRIMAEAESKETSRVIKVSDKIPFLSKALKNELKKWRANPKVQVCSNQDKSKYPDMIVPFNSSTKAKLQLEMYGMDCTRSRLIPEWVRNIFLLERKAKPKIPRKVRASLSETFVDTGKSLSLIPKSSKANLGQAGRKLKLSRPNQNLLKGNKRSLIRKLFENYPSILFGVVFKTEVIPKEWVRYCIHLGGGLFQIFRKPTRNIGTNLIRGLVHRHSNVEWSQIISKLSHLRIIIERPMANACPFTDE